MVRASIDSEDGSANLKTTQRSCNFEVSNACFDLSTFLARIRKIGITATVPYSYVYSFLGGSN
jgi:hypothetical protein